MDKKITIRIDEITHSALKKAAKAEYRSITMWIAHLMETKLKESGFLTAEKTVQVNPNSIIRSIKAKSADSIFTNTETGGASDKPRG